jgi:hypothetical protein
MYHHANAGQSSDARPALYLTAAAPEPVYNSATTLTACKENCLCHGTVQPMRREAMSLIFQRVMTHSTVNLDGSTVMKPMELEHLRPIVQADAHKA